MNATARAGAWIALTAGVGSLPTHDAVARRLLHAFAASTGTTNALLYVADAPDATWPLAAALGIEAPLGTLPAGWRPLRQLAHARRPLPLEDGDHPDVPSDGLAVPLAWRERLVGVLVARLDGGADVDFLATVAEQAAAILVAARASDAPARAEDVEAFPPATAFVMHDLKNAIAALSMLSGNATRHFDDPAFRRDALRTLAATVERMTRLLGTLRVTRNDTARAVEPLDLSALAAATAAPFVASARVTVRQDLRPVPPILGDRAALESVLVNLLINAVDAMHGDGDITLRTEVHDGLVACTVGDSGCGMPAEFVRRGLFVPFRSTKKGGWGIGLYQVRATIEAHRGRLEVESEQGRGTVFRLLFPPAPTAATRARAG